MSLDQSTANQHLPRFEDILLLCKTDCGTPDADIMANVSDCVILMHECLHNASLEALMNCLPPKIPRVYTSTPNMGLVVLCDSLCIAYKIQPSQTMKVIS